MCLIVAATLLLGSPPFPLLPRLGQNEVDYRRRLEETWREFVQSEVAELTTDDEFARAVCTATAFGNKDPGVVAEQWLDRFLKDRYGIDHL